MNRLNFNTINIKFVKVICKNCKAENIIFTRATTRVKCPDCNKTQSVPKGSKCKLINCTIKEEYR